MTSCRAPLAVLILLAFASASLAKSFEDPRNGIKLIFDEQYFVVSEPPIGQPHSSMIFISTRDGHPFVPGSNQAMCNITQWPAPEYAGLTQGEVNAMAPTWPADVITGMMGTVALDSAEPFEHAGLTGMEVVTRTTQSLVGEQLLVFYIFATPSSHTSMACGATDATLPNALLAYRRLRDGLSLPQ